MRNGGQPSFERAHEGPDGLRLCIFHRPQPTARGVVVQVHAFAEEMNKSRRMAALQSRALAEAGFAVLQFDLMGCGDSASDFGSATWASWLADVGWAASLARQRCAADGMNNADTLPLWLWGQRAGCLLACEAATTLPCNLLFWQPHLQGRALLQQFLRLKAAAEWASGGGKGVVTALTAELAAGQAVEVAGYRLHPQLADGLAAAQLLPPTRPARVCWFELSGSEQRALSPAAAGAAVRWQAAGWQWQAHAVQGPAFWQTTEIEDAPELISATVRALLHAETTTA